MKNIIALIILSVGIKTYSQEVNYGISTGISVTGIDNDFEMASGDITPPKGVGFSISGFYDYQLNNSLGLIGNLTYDRKAVDF